MPRPTDDWTVLKAALQKKLDAHGYDMWIEPLTAENSSAEVLLLQCPNAFFSRQVQNRYAALIDGELKALQLRSKRVEYGLMAPADLPPEAVEKPPQRMQMPLPDMGYRVQSGRYLRKSYTFDQFVVGRNNDFAYSASLALASQCSFAQGCLFLLSRSGMGKSHLSQAIGHHILTEHPAERVYYIGAEDFSMEMVQAFKSSELNDFKQKYRNGCDVLLLEDVHKLSGKLRTQAELADTLDFLSDSKKKIIFSSIYPPDEIPKLDDKLRSRLAAGLVSPIEPPTYKTRVRILEQKSKAYGHDLPADVIQFLASHLTRDVRQLESGLVGVATKSSLLGLSADLDLAKEVVDSITSRKKTVTIEAIKKLVCREYGVSNADLVSKSRKQAIVRPRQVAMYLSRRFTDAPLQMIGKCFNRYHATALYAVNAVERSMGQKGDVYGQVRRLSEKIEKGDL